MALANNPIDYCYSLFRKIGMEGSNTKNSLMKRIIPQQRLGHRVASIVLAGALTIQCTYANNVAIINGLSTTSEVGTTNDITAHLQTLEANAGNTVTLFDTPPTDLSSFGQVWDIRFSNSSPLSSAVQTQYLDFLKSGKSMFLLGENGSFMTRNDSLFSLVSTAGGGTLTFATPSPAQTIDPRFGSGTISYRAPGGVSNAGTGAFMTSAGGQGTGVVWSAGTLSNATLGTLTMVLDVNFMQGTAESGSQAFLATLIQFVTSASIESAVAPSDPVRYILEDTGAILSANTTGLSMSLAHRQAILGVAQTATQDINDRLFRLRMRTVEDPATQKLQPVGTQLVDHKGDYKKSEAVAPIDRRWSFFAAGNYGNSDIEARGTTTGFGSDVYTETVGAEFDATNNLTFGAAVTALESNQCIGQHTGKLDIDGAGFSGYVSWFWQNLYADALYNFGTYESEVKRDTLLGNTATGHPDAQSHTVQLNTGYNLKLSGLTTGPIAALDYVNANIGGYTEDRGRNADLIVQGQNFDSLISKIGWQVSYPMPTTFGSVTPQIKASWGHEYLNTDELVDVSLVNSPYTLIDGLTTTQGGAYHTSANTTALGTDFLAAGAGVMVGLGERVSVIVDYNTRLFQAGGVTQCVSITGAIKF